MQLTEQQNAIIRSFVNGDSVVTDALAGCLAADTIINVNRGGSGGQYVGIGKGSRCTIQQIALQLAGRPTMQRLVHGKSSSPV
jgi:hypothetical protein